MNNFNYDNYAYFISSKPKFYNIITFTLLIIISLIIYSFTIKTSDVLNIIAQYNCEDTCKITIQAPLDKVDKLSKASNLKVSKQMIDINKSQVGDVNTDQFSKTNYQLINYDIEKQDIIENTYQDVKIYFNEEILFNKIVSYFIK